jgi:hypothetical protein
MTNYIYLTYSILTILSFASFELLNRPILNRISFSISLIFYGLAFYLYFTNLTRDNISFAFFLTWWTYFILTYHLLRRQFLKEKNVEPIMTKGSAYDYNTGRKANYADYIFTFLMIIMPTFLSYLTSLIMKACC